MLQEQQADHERRRHSRTSTLAVMARQFLVDPVPIYFSGQPHQCVLQINDLVKPRFEQITRPIRLRLRWPHTFPHLTRRKKHAGHKKRKRKLQASDTQTLKTCEIEYFLKPKTDSRPNG